MAYMQLEAYFGCASSRDFVCGASKIRPKVGGCLEPSKEATRIRSGLTLLFLYKEQTSTLVPSFGATMTGDPPFLEILSTNGCFLKRGASHFKWNTPY